MIYKRSLALPKTSFFLFGPRATGKTTWLKAVLPVASWFNLLDSKIFLKLLKDPSLIRKEVEALPKNSWIVIDEVQKLPIILNEVHLIIETYGDKYKFALSGSSARKLKRVDTNLLAGRAINRKFFPLTIKEFNYDYDINQILAFGCLPKICLEPNLAIDILSSYVTNYLKEEIQQEAFVKDFGSFTRFLEVAAICNGQIVNISNIARDAGVARRTVQRYFDVLKTTLIGSFLPAWKKKIKVKEISHPKFYFFDTGVVRAIQDLLYDPIEKAEKGALLETMVFHELNSYRNISNCGGKFSYWRTPSNVEVDFIWQRGKKVVAIEVKSTEKYKSEHTKALKRLLQEQHINAGYVIYLGEKILSDNNIKILPINDFIKELYLNNVLY